jgi:hypothetical protein
MGVWWWLVVVAELLHNKAQENAWTSRLELYALGTVLRNIPLVNL